MDMDVAREACSMNISISEQDNFGVIRCLTTVDDGVLVSAAKAGDTNAFVELYKRHARRVLPKIYLITKNREDAEDAFQDTIMRAFAHLNCFEGRSSFRSWLTRIAINSALMILKKRRGAAEVSLEEVHDDSENLSFWEPLDQAETPEACCMRREREQILSNVIGRLPLTFREPIELRYLRGYSVAQVAEELGISRSAAKTRLMRARKNARRRLPKTRLSTVTRPISSGGHRRTALIGKLEIHTYRADLHARNAGDGVQRPRRGVKGNTR